MKMRMYSLYDRTAKAFGQPFFQPNDAVAQRVTQTLVNNPEATMHSYPNDFELWLIGEYDDNQGIVVPLKDKVLDVETLVSRDAEQLPKILQKQAS